MERRRYHCYFSLINFWFCLLHLISFPLSGSAQFSIGREVGEIQADEIDEASGLVASRQHNGVLWVNEDKSSGRTVILHAITVNGDYLGHYVLEGVENRDMEDIAKGPGPEPGQWYLYLGDIGNNWEKVDSREAVQIYRLKEPNPPSSGFDGTEPQTLGGVDTLTLRYPTYDPEKYLDSEALLVDPILGEIYVLRKQSGSKITIYATGPDTIFSPGSFELTLEDRGFVDGIGSITGGDISHTGREILLKKRSEVFYFQRSGNDPVAESLINQEGFQELDYEMERQGEAIAFAADLSGYYTLSETRGAGSVPLLFYPREGAIPASAPTPPTPQPVVAPTPSPTREPTPSPTAKPTPSPTLPTTPAPTRQPTPSPTPEPTAEPTVAPTFNPTTSSEPTSTNYVTPLKAQFVCNNNGCTAPLQRCEGDCDRDNDCAEDLVCWQRAPGQSTPGCIIRVEGDSGSDYCIRRSQVYPNQVQLVCNNNGCTAPLQICQGDCDNDGDCAEALVCWQRGSKELVPGCIGGEEYEDDTDFCIAKSTEGFFNGTNTNATNATNTLAAPGLLLQLGNDTTVDVSKVSIERKAGP